MFQNSFTEIVAFIVYNFIIRRVQLECRDVNRRSSIGSNCSRTLEQKSRLLPEHLKSKHLPLHQAGAEGEIRYSSYSFLASALDGVSGQRHARPHFIPGERTPGTHWTEGWVGLRAGPETDAREKIICLCRGSNTGRPVCSQTIY
jgi:hypothetical protein